MITNELKADEETNILLKQMAGHSSRALDAARKLPELQRAKLAKFCYERVHMHELGLRIAATCDFHILRTSFGTAARIVYQQSRDVKQTISALKPDMYDRPSNVIRLAGRTFN